jgi:hypothetical protein
MSSQEAADRIDPYKYQVFICASSAALPFITFRHPWLVINEHGKLARYEIRHTKNVDKRLGHLYIDAQEPFQGLPLIYGLPFFFQTTQVLRSISGDENSLAKKVVDFIKDSPITYPLIGQYSFTGPNCATYVEWVLDHFKDLNVKLPWTAIGKNYKGHRV